MIYDEENFKCVCHPTTPYRTEEGCIACDAPKIWDEDTESCNCPSNLKWNPKTKECECKFPGQVLDKKTGECSCPEDQE